MKTRFSLLIVMALLLGLLPAVAVAAPPKPPYVGARDWTLPVDPDILPVGAWLSAWDVSWRVPKAATLALGYKSCKGGICQEVVDSKVYRVTKDDRYPQNLDLEGTFPHQLEAGNCTLQQFVRVWDAQGAVLATAWSQQDSICIDP